MFVCCDAQGPNLIINQPDELLDGMSEWCKEHHGKVGYHVILCDFDKQNLGLNIILKKRFIYIKVCHDITFCTLAFLLGFEKICF